MFVTCSYSEDTDIINILHEIGMRTFEDVFRENMIRIQDVEDLTDKDFEKLGVTAIGLQLRVKQACRNQRQEMMFWSKEPVACYNGIRKETIESRNPKIHLKLILISFWLFGLERTQSLH
ncbi:uncharacterized protein LOC111138457 isoform X3 [Crassostrea virginica]